MRPRKSIRILSVAAFGSVAFGSLLTLQAGLAQDSPPVQADPQPSSRVPLTRDIAREPVTKLFPGMVSLDPEIENPLANDPSAVQNGMKHFNHFNCIGCHAPNGGGGMGPALSNAQFVYGGKPADIFLSIYQGRPAGMPSWGGTLPDKVIWELVAYIQRISKEPAGRWGKTTSRVQPEAPSIEQVPVEYLTTTNPWRYTEPFSEGQRPFEKLKPKIKK